MKKILIAVDYDPTAKKVAEKGLELAKSMNAEVVLLHVVSNVAYYSTLEASPIMGFNEFNYTDFTQLIDVDGVKKAAQYYLDKLKHHLGDETIQTMIEDGESAETIIATAKKLHADIIVMGTHSRRWLEQILVGSETEKVLNLTTIPLFVVPTKGHK